MRLLFCVAAILAMCQAARIARGIDPFPNFHAIHHGDGATSYQNVQMDNYGSVPVPAGNDHKVSNHRHYQRQQYHQEEEQQIIVIHEISQNLNTEDHLESPSVVQIPAVENEHVRHFILVEKDHQELLPIDEKQEHIQHYITLQVPYSNDIQRMELHNTPQIQYYDDTYNNNNHGYEYH